MAPGLSKVRSGLRKTSRSGFPGPSLSPGGIIERLSGASKPALVTSSACAPATSTAGRSGLSYLSYAKLGVLCRRPRWR